VVIVDTVVATLVLRALSWLSSWTPIAVSVGGFWTSLLVVLLMTAVLLGAAGAAVGPPGGISA